MTDLRQTIASVVFGAVCMTGSAGCAKTTTQVIVETSPVTNGGAPMHMMIRALPDSLEQESYEQIAAMMFVEPPDESVIATQALFPGERAAISLPDVGKNDIVMYFFFTTPDPKDGFRQRIPRPIPAEIYVVLGGQTVERVQVRRR